VDGGVKFFSNVPQNRRTL